MLRHTVILSEACGEGPAGSGHFSVHSPEKGSVKKSEAEASSSYHLQLPHLFGQKLKADCHLRLAYTWHTNDTSDICMTSVRKTICATADRKRKVYIAEAW